MRIRRGPSMKGLKLRAKYPGNGYYYILCDVCGRKIRSKDAVLIKDKFNLLNNMLVCKEDNDETNPQQYIKSVRERQIDNPAFIRSEGTDREVFASEPSEIETPDPSDPVGRTASAPRYLVVIGATASSVELQWMGPLDSGSSAPCGYQIERESPVGGGFNTLITTTTPALYYNDTTVSASTQYNYRVSVSNTAGIGDASNEAAITTSSS